LRGRSKWTWLYTIKLDLQKHRLSLHRTVQDDTGCGHECYVEAMLFDDDDASLWYTVD